MNYLYLYYYPLCTTFQHKGDSTYITRFTDGCNYKMNIDEAQKAKQLFESELEKLIIDAKVPRADALNIDVHTVANSTAQRTTRRPVLAEGEEKDTDQYERIFEEEYDGDIPNILVGLEFPTSEREKDGILIPLWEWVLRRLSERLLEEGTAVPSRTLLNLEKAEKLLGDN